VRAAVYPVASLEFKDGALATCNLMTGNDKSLLLWLPAEQKAA
jgi:hypothetical protein